MNLLIIHWGAYTHTDILQTLSALGISCNIITWSFTDKNEDPVFAKRLTGSLQEFSYDAVFTVNYFPVIAQVCHDTQHKYISWSYDCPLNVYNIEDTLGYETNSVFLFDRIQTEHYRKLGYDNVYHLPLAVNPKRLSSITPGSRETAHFCSRISFVGSLYPSVFPDISGLLSDYMQGYLASLIDAQFHVYGHYFMEEFLTPGLLADINSQLAACTEPSPFVTSVTKEQLAYAMASSLTNRERLLLLKALSASLEVKLYSREKHPLLPAGIRNEPVDYLTEMPLIFKTSDINLNITIKNTPSGIPLRALDIMGCGGFLLSNYQPELAEYFVPEEDFAFYDSIEDAVSKADFYLRHEDLRQQIRQRGYEKCCRFFSYTSQLSKLLAVSLP